MKKLFPTDPAETRRAELNQSATDLARIPAHMSEHRLLHDKLAAAKRRRIKGRIGGTLALILYAAILPALTIRALETPRLPHPPTPLLPKPATERSVPPCPEK